MDVQKYFFPLGVGAAIIGIWVALRKPNTGPLQSNQISPAASGLPNYTPQAVQYQVNPPQLAAPSQIQLLGDPWDPNPAIPTNPQNQTPPAYLAFNFGPGHDLSKIPLTDDQIAQLNGNRPTQQASSCGTCGGCSGGNSGGNCANDPNKSVFPDGRGGYMATNGRQLVQKMNRQDPAWPQRAAYNIAGSDITPEQLPYANQMPVATANNQTSPAAPNQTLTPAAPGANAVNQPIGQNPPIGLNVIPQRNPLGNLAQYGNQVLGLSAETVSRLTGAKWVS